MATTMLQDDDFEQLLRQSLAPESNTESKEEMDIIGQALTDAIAQMGNSDTPDDDIVEGLVSTVKLEAEGDSIEALLAASLQNTKRPAEDEEHVPVKKRQVVMDNVPGKGALGQLTPESLSPRSEGEVTKTVITDESYKNNSDTPGVEVMNQIMEMKKRVISTHKLMLNFNFLKDGYSKTCVDLKRAVTRLRQSEVERAHLIKENHNLRQLCLKLSGELDSMREAQALATNLDGLLDAPLNNDLDA